MKRVIPFLLAIVMLLSLSACGKKETAEISDQTEQTVKETAGFSDQTRQAVKDFVAMYGKDSPDYQGNAYVVSDFDNTTCVFDITYQSIVCQIERMAFAMDPHALETALAVGLDLNADQNAEWIADIAAAYAYLWETYGPFTPAGVDEKTEETIQSDPMWMEFAAKMRAFLYHVEDTTPEEVNYAWILYWFSGMTQDEVYDLFYRSCSENEKVESEWVTWTSPKEVESLLGVIECAFQRGVSVTQDVKDMLKAFHDGGIDVWICSASHLDGVRAAVDAFGLSEWVTGVIGMTQTMENGVYLPSYDYENGYAWDNLGDGKWQPSEYRIQALPGMEGKVTAVENALVPRYGCGPLAGFMDSSGDFNFCTEFDSLKFVICYNRANRKITEGAGLIAVLAVYQQETLGYDLAKANAAGDTYFVLQGRDENGLRTMRPSNETIRLGEKKAQLFANKDNETLLQYAVEHGLTTADFLNTFAYATPADDPGNLLGIEYGHLETYRGYHSVPDPAPELEDVA